MDLIKIVNTGDKPLVLRHDGKGNVAIAPGKERILPADYATIHFGNPGARNIGRDRAREVEYVNARTMWGFYEGLMTEEEWETTYKPRYECYDMEGERVYMVLDDRDGEFATSRTGVPTLDASAQVENKVVMDQIARLTAQVEALSNALLVQNSMAASAPARDVDLTPEEPDDDSGDNVPGDASEDAGVDSGKGDVEKRNEQRDVIPKPDENEPAAVADKPRTTRVGSRGKTSTPKST